MLKNIFSLRARQAAKNIRQVEEEFMWRLTREMASYHRHHAEMQAALEMADSTNAMISQLQLGLDVANLQRTFEVYDTFRTAMASGTNKHMRAYYEDGKSQLAAFDKAYGQLSDDTRKDVAKVITAVAPHCPTHQQATDKLRARNKFKIW